MMIERPRALNILRLEYSTTSYWKPASSRLTIRASYPAGATVSKRKYRSDLVVFISHKLQSSDRAREIAVALSAFGGVGISMHYSGKYQSGINYRQQIEKDLTAASWLILLYGGPQFE
jgi:hypothetical protein